MPDNFDFTADEGEPGWQDSYSAEPFNRLLTVREFLRLKFGKERGSKIYNLLAFVAQQAAEENGGQPGVIFSDEGGEFVSFHQQYGS